MTAPPLTQVAGATSSGFRAMAERTERLPAGAGLGRRGRAFWRRVHLAFQLSEVERELLLEACRVLDEIDALAGQVATDGRMIAGSRGQLVAHPAIAELRQQRDVLGRLVGRLALPAEDENEDAASRLGRAGAAARWGYRPRLSAVSKRRA